MEVDAEGNEGVHTNELDHDHPLFEAKDLERPSGIRIKGITTPPVVTDMFSEETPRLTPEDLEEWCERCVKLPVLSEHTVGKVLGRVLSAKPDAQGRVEVEVEFEDIPESYEAIKDIAKKKKIGFSWGARHLQVDDSKLVKAWADKKPVELTITESPEFAEDALITVLPQKHSKYEEMRQRVLQVLRTTEGREYFNAPQYMGKPRAAAAPPAIF